MLISIDQEGWFNENLFSQIVSVKSSVSLYQIHYKKLFVFM